MKVAVYPGSFDPITNGHIDILSRATVLFDKVIISVLENPEKTPLLDLEKRLELIRTATKDMPKVEVDCFSGLTVNYALQKKACTIIRGLRVISDFEKELQMAHINRKMTPEIDTIFLMCNLKYAFLSSSMVKEISFLGGDINCLVPECVKTHLNKLRETR